MSNSNLRKKRVITPERASVIFPLIISSIIAVIVVISFVIPKYVRSNKVKGEYKEYLRKRDELPKLKSQYKLINAKLKKLDKRKQKIIKLVSGTSNLDTFLSTIGSIGQKYNMNFNSIIPKSIIKYVPNENNNQTNNVSVDVTNLDPNSDALLVEGIKKYTVDLNFDSNYRNLLSFLRELEFQENVILFRDLKIKINETEDIEPEKKLIVSLKMVVYGLQ